MGPYAPSCRSTDVLGGRAASGEESDDATAQALIRRSPGAPIHAGRQVLTKERIVAVGLLTQRDLDVLGAGFHRLFSVDDSDGDDAFADLIAQLEKIDAITPVPDFLPR